MDIGFMELLLISIVALIVLGPEKLPQAVRTGALWLGRARRSFNKVKAEIEREINADEIRRQLHNESILADLEEARDKASEVVKQSRDSASELNREVRRGLEGGAGGTRADDTEKKAQQQPSADADGVSPEPGAGQDGEQKAEKGAQDDDGEREKDKTEVGPVTDFYNNPPGGVVTVQDGKAGEPARRVSDQDTGEQDRNDKKS